MCRTAQTITQCLCTLTCNPQTHPHISCTVFCPRLVADRSQVQLSWQWILSHGTITPVSQFHPFIFAQRHETLNVYFQFAVCHALRLVTAICVTALTAMEKLSGRDWHFLLPCIEVSEWVLCDQNTAECQHVKICPSPFLQYSFTQRHHVKICPSLLLQHSDTQVSACSSTTHVSTFPFMSFSCLQT